MLTGAADRVYLPPGMLHAAPAPCVITTVLGSCVAVCLWSSQPRVGGMNHYLLPHGPNAEGSMRYGDTALALLWTRLLLLGASPDGLEARVYGGAAMAPVEAMRLGRDNVQLARSWLGTHGIAIVDEDVLGNRARRVELDVTTGAVRVGRVGAA